MGALLKVKNLKKYFKTVGGMLHAVDDVSFSISEGQTLGVVGESGCGKTTLGRVVLGLLEATAGEVYFEGKDITNVDSNEFHKLRRKMQIIFQDPFSSLNPRMSVGEIIGEPFLIHNTCKSEDEREGKVMDLMKTVGLDRRYVNSYPHELDGGRRQRIGVARALALNPSFIVCDEPVSALDVSIQAQILNLMQDLQEQQNLAYLFITHNLAVVKHISDNIMVMYLGKTVELCGVKELFSNNLHPYTKALLSAIPVPAIHERKKRILLKGELSSPIDPAPGCRFAARCNYTTPECFEVDPVLTEYSPGHFVSCHNVEAAKQ